jgi:dolichol-phosphate mannosyltransferase
MATEPPRSRDIVLSVVSPVYMAEESIEELVDGLHRATIEITSDYEIILVDDGSPDDGWNKIRQLCAGDSRVKGIKLSRNFGQHYAITAGLEYSGGQFVAVMDCDLQHDPIYIRDLMDAARKGFDIVYTGTDRRSHSPFKNITSKLFYKLFNWLTDISISEANVGSYSLLTRKAVNSFLRFHDFHRHYLLVVRLLGYRSTTVAIEHRPRKKGRSSYTLKKLILHAIDGITSQSNKLLRVIVNLGLLFVLGSAIASAVIVYRYSVHGFLPGWTSLIVVTLLCSGVILMSLGVIGIYLSKIFDQVKGRPMYIVESVENI